MNDTATVRALGKLLEPLLRRVFDEHVELCNGTATARTVSSTHGLTARDGSRRVLELL